MKQLINKYIVGLLFVSALGLFLIPSASRVEAATFLAGKTHITTNLDKNIYVPSSVIQISTSVDSVLFEGDATAIMYDSSNNIKKGSPVITVLSRREGLYNTSFDFVAPPATGNYFIRVSAFYDSQTDPNNSYCYNNYIEQILCIGYSVYIDLPFQVLPLNVAVTAIDSSNNTTTSLVGGGGVYIRWTPNFNTQKCDCSYIGFTTNGIKSSGIKSKLSCGTSEFLFKDSQYIPTVQYNISKTTTFDVTCNTAVPVDGVCGTSLYTCTTGTPINKSTTATDYIWDCNGLYGGASALSCSLPISSGTIPPSGGCPSSEYYSHIGTCVPILKPKTGYN